MDQDKYCNDSHVGIGGTLTFLVLPASQWESIVLDKRTSEEQQLGDFVSMNKMQSKSAKMSQESRQG